MKAEKNPQTQSLASLPNPERRKFLGNALFAGAALATGCKSENPYPERRETIYQNRELRIGSFSVTFDGCRDDGESPSAYFSIRKAGKEGLESTVSMLVPGSFKIHGSGTEYEISVESVSCSESPSAEIIIISKSVSEENPSYGVIRDNMPVLASALGVIASFIYFSFQRKKERGQDERKGMMLSPRRHGSKTE